MKTIEIFQGLSVDLINAIDVDLIIYSSQVIL